jgi:tetratricopeptide (TPR) repeat protein
MLAEKTTLNDRLAMALAHHQAGQLDQAAALYEAVLQRHGPVADALHLLGLIQLKRGQLNRARTLIAGAIVRFPGVARFHNSHGAVLRDMGDIAAAEHAFLRSTSLNPQVSQAWHNLVQLRESTGDTVGSMRALEALLVHHPKDMDARMRLASLHYAARDFPAAIQQFEAAARLRPQSPDPLLRAGLVALEAGDSEQGLAAFARAQLRHYADPDIRTATTRSKLTHDIEQLQWLATNNGLAPENTGAIMALQGVRAAMFPDGPASRVGRTIPEALRQRIDPWYNRRPQVIACPALSGSALSDSVQFSDAVARYQATQPGIVTIDNLLCPEALDTLRRFCLGATIWSDFRYAGGYVGSTLKSGFSNGLLFQIADELRAAMPALLQDHPLRQLWAFKYDPRLQGITPHADEAAINVNFWITPDSANKNPDGGGLVVYRKEAPIAWDFEAFNRQPEKLLTWVKSTGAERLRVPHRQNRAVIFNSNLVHQTDTLDFHAGYENRRINITMLFGDRVK